MKTKLNERTKFGKGLIQLDARQLQSIKGGAESQTTNTIKEVDKRTTENIQPMNRV